MNYQSQVFNSNFEIANQYSKHCPFKSTISRKVRIKAANKLYHDKMKYVYEYVRNEVKIL